MGHKAIMMEHSGIIDRRYSIDYYFPRTGDGILPLMPDLNTLAAIVQYHGEPITTPVVYYIAPSDDPKDAPLADGEMYRSYRLVTDVAPYSRDGSNHSYAGGIYGIGLTWERLFEWAHQEVQRDARERIGLQRFVL